ncbi:MAG: polysaccharide pyruvyl transferase family protein [Solirubrobacteraceae bacterium]|nr:polysaccharide pyruvyl transferase family protein [Solirubrobacteraceae bacterium]
MSELNGGGPHQIDLYSWNPQRRLTGRVGRRIPWTRRLNNFGDLIGPLVVRGMLKRLGLEGRAPARSAQLVSVGSVIHLADPGAVIWGSGVNGKVPEAAHNLVDLDVRAVRGPLTREFLRERGTNAPPVYGDPALLLPTLYPELADGRKRYSVTVVPNFNDAQSMRRGRNVMDPRGELMGCLRRIAASKFVVGSSLHGIIVAEAFGVPAKLVRSGQEADFKYADYYQATGRPTFSPAPDVRSALESDPEPPLVWDPEALMSAFPSDLWSH